MSQTLTAVVVLPGVTYCSNDGVPYRSDESGIVHVTAAHAIELVARGVAAVATATQMGATKHKGSPLQIQVG
jgi:hypothetical protein